jgi:hypothetical protein
MQSLAIQFKISRVFVVVVVVVVVVVEPQCLKSLK